MKTNDALSKQVGGDHYKKLAIQPIEYCMANKLNACQTLAIRYITRYKDKGGVQDIDKAIHVLELLKGLEYGEEEAPGQQNEDDDEERMLMGVNTEKPTKYPAKGASKEDLFKPPMSILWLR